MVEENDPIVSFSASEGGVLNTSVHNVEMRFSDLVALLNDEEEKVADKDGPYIVPSAMRNDKRHGNNAYDAGLLGFDIEDHPLDLDDLRAFMPHRAVVYSTHSHGVRFDSDGDPKWMPGYPRIRLLLPLARPVSAKEYKVLHAWGISRLDGLQSPDKALAHPDSIADPAAKDPSRAFYMPRKKAEDAERDPFFLDWSGDVLDPDNLPDGQSVADLLGKSEKAKPTKKKQRDLAGTDALLMQTREALTFVEPDEYNDWYKVGFALKDAFGDDGLPAFIDWSRRADNPADEREIERKWHNDLNGEVDKKYTVRSIHWNARANGWTEEVPLDEAVSIIDECRTVPDFFADQTLAAAACLRMDRGAEWALVVESIKQNPVVGRFTDWEKAVIKKQRSIETGKKEARAAIRESELLAQKQANTAPISNFEREYIEGEEVRYRKDLQTIVDEIRARTGGWPRLMDNVLFVPDQYKMDAQFFKKAPELFSWLEIETGGIEWTDREVLVDGGGSVKPTNETKTFSAIAQAMPEDHRYQTIETIPHVPLVDHAYYFPRDLPEATGEVLARLLALFNPAHPEDAALIEAMLLTGMWGGGPGKRPAFVITSDHGRGSGKTSTARAIANVFGGVIGIKAEEGWGNLQQRLLDPSTATKRYCLIDNLKNRLSSAEFESAITESVINGKRMYVGDGERVNLLTWIFTANTPSLSNDLASRSVVIKVGKADHSIDFEAEIEDILGNHADALLADIKARLEEPASGEVVNNFDRWQSWQRAILSRFPDADHLAGVIQDRRGEVDDDAATAELWADLIKDLLREKKHTPETCSVVIPSQQITDLARNVEDDRTIGFRAAWDLVRDVIGVGPMSGTRKVKNPCRGLLWVGADASPTVKYEKFGEPENPVNWKNKNVGDVSKENKNRKYL